MINETMNGMIEFQILFVLKKINKGTNMVKAILLGLINVTAPNIKPIMNKNGLDAFLQARLTK